MSLDAIKKRCGDGNQKRTADMLREDPSFCIPYSTSRQMSGLWVHGFEYSAFFEGYRSWKDVSQLAFDPDEKSTWLSVPASIHIPLDRAQGVEEYQVFRVELVGKRSLCAFGYGHMGSSDQDVMVERLISVTKLDTVR